MTGHIVRALACVLLLVDGMAIWPAPSKEMYGVSTRFLAADFKMEYLGPAVPHTLSEAFIRYRSLILARRCAETSGGGDIGALSVSVDSILETPPQLGTDESYTLTVAASGNAVLHAATVYGALRGLESFSQLVSFDSHTATYTVQQTPLHIDDAPRFAHRGFMVDTSRHYQSVGMLKSLIDSLSYAKFNTLHWHAIDDQSFPLTVKSFPKLQGMGAFSIAETYTPLDVADIVEYARLRGMRVLLEIDTPSHTACWCRGYPSICPPKPCKMGATRTPLDISKNQTFATIQSILEELAPQFPERLLHIGQDEVDVGCWSAAENPTIGAWQKAMGFTIPDEAYVYTAGRIGEGVRKLSRRPVQWWPGLCLGNPTGNRTCGQQTGFCPCRGVVSDANGASQLETLNGLDKSTVLQLWADGPEWNATVLDVVQAGYSTILSTPWYLQDIHLTATWQSFYTVEPLDGVPADLHARVLGGEACMWGEWIDGSQLLNTAWPRTAATAERLWSPRDVNSTTLAAPRLARFRCLLLERGIPAGVLDFSKASPYGTARAGQPPPGPGSCLSQ